MSSLLPGTENLDAVLPNECQPWEVETCSPLPASGQAVTMNIFRLPLPATRLIQLLLIAVGFLAPDSSVHAGPRPNLLLVISDDHSFPHVGCYGNPDIRTPNLDQFAAHGMRFDRAYVMSPQCVPSRASLMTGRSPVAIQMVRFSAPLPADVTAFPEVLRANGYFTGICGRSHHLDGNTSPPESKKVYDENNLETMHKRVDFLRKDMATAVSDMQEFLKKVPAGKPFFLQVGSNDPHRSFTTKGKGKPHDPARLKLPPHFPDTQLVREDLAAHYDEIAHLDDFFGELMAVLDEHNLATNTLVMFTGDNGAALLRGKGTLFETGIHVPLLVRWPGRVKAGAATDELISGEDLAPTFLEAAGAPVPKAMTGRSFLNLLVGDSFHGRKFVFSERGPHATGLPGNTASFDLGRCVVTKTHKLIYNALPHLPYTPVDFSGHPFWKNLRSLHEEGKLSPEFSTLYFSPTRPLFQLFDLKNDPGEFKNLIDDASSAAVTRELKTALQEWMILNRDFLPLPIAKGAGLEKPRRKGQNDK